MNPPTPQDVEDAVRSVLAALRGPAGSSPSSRGPHFAGRLLGLRQAEALDLSGGELRIAPGTVVTPLARDFLKRRGVEIWLVSERDAGLDREPGEWGFVFEAEGSILNAVRRLVLGSGSPWREVGHTLRDAAAWVSGSDRRGAVVVTPEASVATWRAHRVEGVRAATVGDADAVTRAVRALGANLLVIEPAGHSIHGLAQLFQTYCRHGAPRCPAELGRDPGRGSDDDANRRGDRPGDARAAAPQSEERALRDRLALAARGLDGGLPRAW